MLRGILQVCGLITLGGCTPFVGYSHVSMPNVSDDGYDFICGGVEYRRGIVTSDVSICENLANSHTDTFAKIDVKVRLGGE